MSQRLIIESDGIELTLELSSHPFTDELVRVLPLESRLSTWGDEFYFPVPVDVSPVDPTTDLEVGDVAYWPQGQSLAVFFGPTPRSTGDRPVPADSVDVVGRIAGELEPCHQLQAGDSITLRRAP